MRNEAIERNRRLMDSKGYSSLRQFNADIAHMRTHIISAGKRITDIQTRARTLNEQRLTNDSNTHTLLEPIQFSHGNLLEVTAAINQTTGFKRFGDIYLVPPKTKHILETLNILFHSVPQGPIPEQ